MTTQLPKFTSIGCYPLFYRGKHDAILCADCAPREGLTELDAHVYWEGQPLECDNCGSIIESAYGDPEEENS